VPRPRLSDRLNRGTGSTLVAAPAGFGKTTLLTGLLAAAPAAERSAAWLSLDRGAAIARERRPDQTTHVPRQESQMQPIPQGRCGPDAYPKTVRPSRAVAEGETR
jgi:hypothetical protein